MALLNKFNIRTISSKLNSINAKISISHGTPFPCLALLSGYQFKKRFVKILPNGDIAGGLCKMIISLIDFSFIRSLTAHRYSLKSPPPYDPTSLFLLELFRYIDGYATMDRFLEVLRDDDRGRAYRAWAGIHHCIPSKGTFSNFKARLGAGLYNEIFHVLVTIFHQLQMISFNILTHDGTLFPTRSRYKGCTYFSDECSSIDSHDIVLRVRRQILYRLNNLPKVNLEKAFSIKETCPCTCFPEGVQPPRVEVLCLKLCHIDGLPSERHTNMAILFGVKDELEIHGLGISIIRSNLSVISPEKGTFRCSKIPTDRDARIGVRRDPQNPKKKEKIFGYNLILSTSVELDIKLELPVAATLIAGNAEEGQKLISNLKQILEHHDCQAKINIADAKYDTTENYQFLRQNGSIPIIDYNVRNEKLTADAIRKRGYDRNGWPLAPCGLTTKPNGFDKAHLRHTFCCFKQCLSLKAAGIRNLQADYDIGSCPHMKNRTGFSQHTYIKDNPRLHNEIPRGSQRYTTIKQIRSASERANSTVKEDLGIINKPIVYNKVRANVLGQITSIVLLLHRACTFIARVSCLLDNYCASKDPAIAEKLNGYYIPKSIRSLIQIE